MPPSASASASKSASSPSASTTRPAQASTSRSASSSAPPATSAPPPTSSGGYKCVTSASHGSCGSFSGYAQITGESAAPTVDQNAWAADSSYKQTLYANGPGDWYITANANTNFGGVLTFPNTGFQMAGKVDARSSVTSSFSTTIPYNAKIAAWAAYDLWFNNWNDEVMIQTNIAANSYYYCAKVVVTATINGEPWHMCVFGSERVWKHGTDERHLINQSSGTINIQSFLTWMEQHGYLPSGSVWTAASYGFEVCDTGGLTDKLQLNGFSWAAR